MSTHQKKFQLQKMETESKGINISMETQVERVKGSSLY